jgi:hypothetical protein
LEQQNLLALKIAHHNATTSRYSMLSIRRYRRYTRILYLYYGNADLGNLLRLFECEGTILKGFSLSELAGLQSKPSVCPPSYFHLTRLRTPLWDVFFSHVKSLQNRRKYFFLYAAFLSSRVRLARFDSRSTRLTLCAYPPIPLPFSTSRSSTTDPRR